MKEYTDADAAAFQKITGKHPHWFDMHEQCDLDCQKSPAYAAAMEKIKAREKASLEARAVVRTILAERAMDGSPEDRARDQHQWWNRNEGRVK